MHGARLTRVDAACQIVKRYAPLGEFALDLKLDGERVQVHWARGGGVSGQDSQAEDVFRVFSRSTEDMTAKYPDAVDAAADAAAPGITSFVLDGEAVAVDGEGRLMPFQHLTTRARCVELAMGVRVAYGHVSGAVVTGACVHVRVWVHSKGSGGQAPAVDVCVYAFDLLLLNGVPLLDVRRCLPCAGAGALCAWRQHVSG